MKNSRLISDLVFPLQLYAREIIEEAEKKNGIRIQIVSTYRDNEYQDYLYSLGRFRPGKLVTNSPGGLSYHNYNSAFDFVILDEYNKPDYYNIQKYLLVDKIAEDKGLLTGKNYNDYGHVQLIDKNIEKKINLLKNRKKDNLLLFAIPAIILFILGRK